MGRGTPKGWSGFLTPRRVERDHRQNAVQMIANIRGPDAQNLNPLHFQPCGSSRVVSDLIRIVVPRAVNFNREARGMAVKVEDVGADRMLAAEFQSLEAAAFNLSP